MAAVGRSWRSFVSTRQHSLRNIEPSAGSTIRTLAGSTIRTRGCWGLTGGLTGADDAWEVPGTMVLGCGGGGD